MGQFSKNCLSQGYTKCFEVAHENNLKSVAFPSISTGAYGYPIGEASKIALTTTLNQLKRFPEIKEAIFVLFSKNDLGVYEKNLDTL